MFLHKTLMSGFTLIELLVTMVIAAILAAVALPAYNNYVTQSRISAAVAQLSDMRVKMEQYFQDNRTYAGACTAGTVAPLPASANNFNYACTCPTAPNPNAPAATTYTVCANGFGSMAGFSYAIDETNTRRTLSLPAGWNGTTGAASTCWVVKNGGC